MTQNEVAVEKLKPLDFCITSWVFSTSERQKSMRQQVSTHTFLHGGGYVMELSLVFFLPPLTSDHHRSLPSTTQLGTFTVIEDKWAAGFRRAPSRLMRKCQNELWCAHGCVHLQKKAFRGRFINSGIVPVSMSLRPIIRIRHYDVNRSIHHQRLLHVCPFSNNFC